MKTIGTAITTTVAFAALFLTSLPGHTQGGKPAEAKAEPAVKVAASASAPKRSSRANEDARACLELATNMEIHKCAEKYR
jgi:hypothetical protein